jgi:pimeloyl-ACP methyl ester carboxylesterase
LTFFNATCGQPARTIAWGTSLGGIITAALAQLHPGRFTGALPMCGVVDGGIGFCQNSEHDQRRDERFPHFRTKWLLLGSLFPTLCTLSSGFSPLNASFFDRVLSSDRTH